VGCRCLQRRGSPADLQNEWTAEWPRLFGHRAKQSEPRLVVALSGLLWLPARAGVAGTLVDERVRPWLCRPLEEPANRRKAGKVPVSRKNTSRVVLGRSLLVFSQSCQSSFVEFFHIEGRVRCAPTPMRGLKRIHNIRCAQYEEFKNTRACLEKGREKIAAAVAANPLVDHILGLQRVLIRCTSHLTTTSLVSLRGGGGGSLCEYEY